MNSLMSCELDLLAISFGAFVAPERLFPSVRPHVALQITRRSASEVALVKFVWLFSCVLHHHVNFQLTNLNAGKLAHCASVGLFSGVGSFVLLHIASQIMSLHHSDQMSQRSQVSRVTLVGSLCNVKSKSQAVSVSVSE